MMRLHRLNYGTQITERSCLSWAFVALFVFTSLTGQAQKERILDYHTRIEVEDDRSITVTETIKVHVEGFVFKRGITRYLPTTRYLNDRLVNVHYDIKRVEKDGQKEPYHTESQGNGIVLYLGSRDVYLEPGDYTYTIQYHVNDQIGFYDDYDEIYWNAVGTKNQVSTERATCEVVLPEGTEVIQQAAYVGSRGEKDQDFRVQQDGNVVRYTVTRALAPGEGFTVAVGFEKGVMPEPGFWDRLGSLIILLLASIFLLPYYIYTWIKHGQDPPTPASYPQWEPPDGLSAASINYVKNGYYQNKSFTASVIDLAIKGHLRIEEEEDKGWFTKKKTYKLIREKESSGELPSEERQLMSALFGIHDEVHIDGEYDSTVEGSHKAHKSSLKAQHSGFIWKGHNARLLVVPALVTIVAIVLAIITMTRSSYGASVNTTALIAFIPLAIASFGLYVWLIRKPTVKKLDLRARIKGFEMYLELAEKERLALLNPPDMTPSHFEAMLPFAFALGVEHTWTEKFKSILDRMNYAPRWTNSTSMMYFSSHFGQDFGRSFAGAATPPSKSGSGSGGGGFSGGGGGGGGVGGW
ncbi:MAG: DUF2207 domain-containing protein [Balneolaceae bacterium]|nr:DUF2207 domain-containing protein [Balneolaceae bacterium]